MTEPSAAHVPRAPADAPRRPVLLPGDPVGALYAEPMRTGAPRSSTLLEQLARGEPVTGTSSL